MKATEIKITIEKVDPKYNDKIWIGVTFQVQESEDLEQSILDAREQLNKAYEAMKEYKEVTTKPRLLSSSDGFISICKALRDKRATIDEITTNYRVSDSALNHLKKLVE